jgi:predicted nucleotidyltransferase
MRITEKQARLLRSAANRWFGSQSRVWLFGSRVDDSKRGGDYDLMIETDLTDPDLIIDRKLRYLAQLQGALEFEGEKVDLVVYSEALGTELPIHKIARQEGVAL